MIIIAGAGMAGCIAGYLFREAEIYEVNYSYDVSKHRAVLRFRDPEVSKITGIPFRKVRVHKEIWIDGCEVSPTIQIANMYSLKVTGKILERSIWDTDPVTRYIAPEDFHARMLETLNDKITFRSGDVIGNKLKDDSIAPIISTMPMFALAKLVDYNFETTNFSYQEISTFRMKLNKCDVFQTIYYPSHDYGLYRATITGNNLIIESIHDQISNHEVEQIVQSFSLKDVNLCDGIFGEHRHTQKFGKIAPIDELTRRNFIRYMTTQHNVFSLGRFATWKNILLDDVIIDIERIKDLIEPWRRTE